MIMDAPVVFFPPSLSTLPVNPCPPHPILHHPTAPYHHDVVQVRPVAKVLAEVADRFQLVVLLGFLLVLPLLLFVELFLFVAMMVVTDTTTDTTTDATTTRRWHLVDVVREEHVLDALGLVRVETELLERVCFVWSVVYGV